MNILAKLWSAIVSAVVQPDPDITFVKGSIPLAPGWRLDLFDVCDDPHYGTFRVRTLVGPKRWQAFTTRHPFVVPPSRN